MIKIHKAIATSLGIGYISKGGGTVAAVFACLCWYYPATHCSNWSYMQVIVTLLITGIGVYSSGKMEPLWGKDDKKVVIDEVAGMCISLMFIHINIISVLTDLILFRFFDIAKPLYIRRTENLRGGWGVMMDDVLSGVYACLIMQLLSRLNLF